MTGTVRWLGVLFGSVAAAGAPAQTPAFTPASAVAPSPAAAPSPAPARIVLSEVVEPAYRDAVMAVARKPTLTTRGASDDLACTAALYEWLLDHPDRVALAWRRLKVPCVEIGDAGNGRFTWADGEGSELAWRTVGRFQGGLVWYATGKVKPSVVAPTVPVKAVVVMTHPTRPAKDDTTALSPGVQVYLQTDSRAATVVMRLLGPTAPKLAEQGAEQLLFFFGGIARYVKAHPEKAEELLGPPRK